LETLYYNWKDVSTNFIDEVYGCRRGIPLTEGKRGEGEGNLGSLSTIEGDAKNQDNVRWLVGEIQGSKS
jgi:hypothetical protein